ncbi:phosphoribosyltransferase-like predicted ribonucleoside biosynthesis protein [Motilibacter rhizosphaerae]|uniref:Phosphoribosyltransferase-like predicted ribonucleoside biosynthesis protein n=1 Tax=Motilibacter rhizosphaerae TaxID=598652 RepID=A0A4Q7NSK7_9ACTN|nr:phosphoribosyltransferase [Motilibacter rhizosphaerae]RZS90091.1 phosphoribosyltransferase-like predicted ribonucleoside biosynthesis protein [Motilibacter rhizosphaerae]
MSRIVDGLGLRLETSGSPLGLELPDLLGLALRRNPRRAHLLVSRVLGKHVPTDPRVVEGAALLLGALTRRLLVAGAHAPGPAEGALLVSALAGKPGAAEQLHGRAVALTQAPPVDALVLAYAETATALGEGVAAALGAPVLCSTRRPALGVPAAAGFEEAHSHATSHLLLPHDPRLLDVPGPLVLVDDELTSGRTVLHTIEALHAVAPRERYVVASLVDLRPEADRDALAAAVGALGATVEVVALVSGRALLPDDVLERAPLLLAGLALPEPPAARPPLPGRSLPWPDGVPESARHGLLPRQRERAAEALGPAAALVAADLPAGARRVLVLGTEELLGLPLRLAVRIAALLPGAEVRSSSTTRSPAQPVDEEGYALRAGLAFRSVEDGGVRYAYNVRPEEWDAVVLVTDTDVPGELAAQLGARLDAYHVEPQLPLPEPLRGPDFGSYAADEVGWLLTDLSGARIEAPVEEREEAIQRGGAHYAESLPVEYSPSAAYLELFEQALEESAAKVAAAVGVVAEIVLAEAGEDVVLASLARAGTPVGILLRRWAARRGLDLPHYALSIVRGRGLDETALRWLVREHGPGRVVFVDGWTGKGAIARELRAALDAVRAGGGPDVAPRLAVLADPGRCVDTFGTREDFLIPSACLNSTVSGLVSRTVLNAELLRPWQFHGAKHYADLAPHDLSARFLDAVSARFDDVAGEVEATWRQVAAGPREPDWSGWAAVEELSDRYGVGDPTLVKPGVGETTRVLLRRVPWRILVRRGAAPALAHVLLLASQRGVEVEEVEDMPYSCVGLIHPRYDRGATGADGLAAAGVQR